MSTPATIDDADTPPDNAKPPLRTFTLLLTDDDYADVLRVLSVREAAAAPDAVVAPTNGALFADVLRAWERSAASREVADAPACDSCGHDTVRDGDGFHCGTCGRRMPRDGAIPLRVQAHPDLYVIAQDVMKRVGIGSLNELCRVTWSLYDHLVRHEEGGGRVLARGTDGKDRRVNLHLHRPPGGGGGGSAAARRPPPPANGKTK